MLPIQRYYKRRIEKDKQTNECEKKREKENERQKLAAAIGAVLTQPTLLQPKTVSQTPSSRSKRNLCGKLEELESESKPTDTTAAYTKPMRRHK